MVLLRKIKRVLREIIFAGANIGTPHSDLTMVDVDALVENVLEESYRSHAPNTPIL